MFQNLLGFFWTHTDSPRPSLSLQVATPRMDMTLAELQEMAARQQQQIEAQQQLLASKVHKEVQDERERRQGLVERWVITMG